MNSTKDEIFNAVDTINRNADKLSDSEKAAIHQVHEIKITPGPVYLGVTGSHSVTLSVTYIQQYTQGWFTSLFAHEGQHILDRGKYNDSDLWKSGQNARRTQAAAGKTLGLEARYIKHLIENSTDAHKDEMQQHMKNGLKE